MRFFRHRITACLAGLAYLLASALSGALHWHSHGEADAHGSRNCLAVEHSHGHARPAADNHECLAGLNDGHENGPRPQPLSDDHCAACRFVSHSAVCCVPVATLKPLGVVAEIRVRAPLFFSQPEARGNRLARAPPLG